MGAGTSPDATRTGSIPPWGLAPALMPQRWTAPHHGGWHRPRRHSNRCHPDPGADSSPDAAGRSVGLPRGCETPALTPQRRARSSQREWEAPALTPQGWAQCCAGGCEDPSPDATGMSTAQPEAVLNTSPDAAGMGTLLPQAPRQQPRCRGDGPGPITAVRPLPPPKPTCLLAKTRRTASRSSSSASIRISSSRASFTRSRSLLSTTKISPGDGEWALLGAQGLCPMRPPRPPPLPGPSPRPRGWGAHPGCSGSNAARGAGSCPAHPRPTR